MLLFGKRKNIDFYICEQNALFSSYLQAMELINHLIDDGKSYIALKDEEDTIKFTDVKSYLFFIEVPLEEQFGSKEGYFSSIKTKNMIRELFHSKKIKDISGLIFKSYL